MRNLKKFLALVLAMMMTLSLLVVANAAPATPTDFTDLDKVSPAYAEAVNVLSALKIIKGDDGFRPGETITRAEVSMILYRVAHNDADESQVKIYKDYDVFPDVQSDKWYAGSVNYCANAGYLKGYPNGSFGPSNEVTGYEVLVMTLRMLGYGKNGEFEGKQGDWRLQAAMYGRKAGLTKQIKEGTLGQPATREMVAEIMFQALQADLVDYNLLQNYYPSNVLIADNEDNRANYANAIRAGRLTLPLNGNLMYVNYGIVGKRAGTPDPFGRPTVEWVKDNDADRMTSSGDITADPVQGDAGKYVVNADIDADGNYVADEDIGTVAEDAAISIAVTPVKVYDNAIDECHLTKDINKDESIYWGAITEIVNGETLDPRTAVKLDALHTTTQFIGATGRTTEIYKVGKVTVNKNTGAINAGPAAPATDVVVDHWTFVYIDTFLGVVDTVYDEVKDSAGHTIIPPTADVLVGNNPANDSELVTLTLANPGGKFQEDDLVLVQTPHADQTDGNDANGAAFVNTDRSGNTPAGGNKTPDPVSNPEKAPLFPSDVPYINKQFVHVVNGAGKDGNGGAAPAKDIAQILTTAPTTVRVTVNATVGAQDAKMGLITTDGKTYMASNTFLAARFDSNGNGAADGVNGTVLHDWYDVDVDALGITNSMIGRTYDITLDHHGYIIGMQEVLTTNSSVGVITGVDSVRIGSGKYLAEVEAYMTDGTTKTFQIGKLVDTTAAHTYTQLSASADIANAGTAVDHVYFSTAAEVDDAWKTTFNAGAGTEAGMYGEDIGTGSLVKFANVTIDGKSYWKIDDFDSTAAATWVQGNQAVGTVKGTADNNGKIETGVTFTLNQPETNATGDRQLDDKSVVFVTEYEYRYNTSGNNDGSNINKTYTVREGFKNIPTIDGKSGNVFYQQLRKPGNTKYFLIGTDDPSEQYTIKNQPKIEVDDSYLILGRGPTYAEYSVYKTLKNGEPYDLKVSNNNKNLNALIESTFDITVDDPAHPGTPLTANKNKLVVVTGTNAKGYVTDVNIGVDTVNASHLAAGEIITGSSTDTIAHSNGVLRTTLKVNTAAGFLTLDNTCKVQLVNRDQDNIQEISIDVATKYCNKEGNLDTYHSMVFELNELGYVCNLYVID